MTTPTLKVEIAFDDDPLTVSPTWTDVTAYVRDSPGVRISRGRPTELDTFTAGQCSFTLDNRDGEFSPLNSGSTYNGKLLPGKQVRITATYSSTDYRLFRGFITGWPQRYAQGKKDAIVPIVAYDALSKLNETDLSDPVYAYAVSIGGVSMYLRNFKGTAWDAAYGSRVAGKVKGGSAAVTSLATGLESDAVECTSARFRVEPSLSSNSNGTWAFWVQTSSAGSSSSVWMSILSSRMFSGTDGFIIGIDNAGLLRFQGYQYNPGSYSTARTQDPINDGFPHHVVIAHDFASNLCIYVDGADNTNLTTGYDYVQPGYAAVEEYIGQDGNGYHTDFTGTLQDILVLDNVVMSGAQAKRLYELSVQTYSRSTGTALGEVLDSAGWPSALRSIASRTYGNVTASWADNDNALSVAQAIATSEQGRLFVSGTGNITLLSRYSHQLDTTGNTSQHTFSDDGSDSDYVDVGFDYDDTRVRNAIQVSGIGVSASAEDATSIADFGRQTASISTYLATNDHCAQMAAGLVGWRKDPQVRSLPLTSVPQTDPAQWPSILALELGQRVTFEITPPGVGSQVATPLILEQMDWDITNALWELTVQGSPIPPNVFILDSSLLDGTDVLGF